MPAFPYPRMNSIRLFEAAARHKNFRLAAEELNLTQGAVAQAVRGLEADLGMALFTRHPRGLSLTEEGQFYHAEVMSGLAIIDEATRKLLSRPDHVTVRTPPSFGSKWLVPKLPYFMDAHPGIEVRTIASDTMADFRDDGVDIAIRHGEAVENNRWTVHHLAPIDLIAVTGRDAGFAKGRRFSSIEDFADLPLIQDDHRHWQRLFLETGLTPPGGMLQINQTALAMDAARNNQGVALAPALLANHEIGLGALQALWRDPSSSAEAFWLVHPKTGRANHPARDTVVAWLRTSCFAEQEPG